MSEPRAGLPSPDASRAVLVGVSEYTTLEELPAVANNVATLHRVLTDADLWGLPAEHCVTLLNPTSVEQVLDAVHTAASAASDALLFYFAGHGLLDDRLDLHLALPGSDSDRLYRAVRYDDVRREVVGAARVFGKVVILDCCFSGRAMQGGMSGPVELADHARVDGTYLMTATAETKLALAPPGEEYTAFTGALLDKLSHGLENGPDLLDMETLFYHVRADLQARHLPVPQQRTRNDGKAIALVRNRRASGRGAVRQLAVKARELPKPPEGWAEALRWPPSKLAQQVRKLRENGDDDLADQLLAASAARRADQEVAAILEVLHQQGTATDILCVFTAAASRPPAEVLRIIDALLDTGLYPDANLLLRTAGREEAANVAGLARLLDAQERTVELFGLLDTALDAAQARSSLTGLVSALWVAGLRGRVDGLLTDAARKLPGPAVVGLADELRTVGREETAFGLYAAAADTVATRSPDTVAQLSQAMIAAGRRKDGERVAQALISMVAGVEEMLGVAVAFWDTEQDVYADQVLARAAGNLSHPDVLTLAADLRARDRDKAAYQLCLAAALSRQPDDIREIIQTLRDAGRPVDAKNLLDAVVAKAPVDTVAGLLTAEAYPDRILSASVAERPPYQVDTLLRRLAPHPDVAQRLVGVVAVMAGGRPDLLPIIISYVDAPTKEWILERVPGWSDGEEIARVLRKLPAEDAKLLFFLAVRRGNPMLEQAITTLQLTTDSNLTDSEFGYLFEQPVDRLALLYDRLRETGFGRYVDALMTKAAAPERGADGIAAHIASLYGTGQADLAGDLLTRALTGRSNDEFKELIVALRRYDQVAALDAVASWIRTTYATIGESNIDYMLRQLGLGEYASRKRGKRG